MKGVAITPGQEWLNRLPKFDVEDPVTGYGIFSGMVNGVPNVLVYIREQQLSILTNTEDPYKIWAYNSASGELYNSAVSGSGWASKIILAAGLPEYSDEPHVEEETITPDMVLFRLDPAE